MNPEQLGASYAIADQLIARERAGGEREKGAQLEAHIPRTRGRRIDEACYPGPECMLLRPAVHSIVRRLAAPPGSLAFPRPVDFPLRSALILHQQRPFASTAPARPNKQFVMSDIKTPEVPPAQQQDAPNLQKDPETGEMVSKRCAAESRSTRRLCPADSCCVRYTPQ